MKSIKELLAKLDDGDNQEIHEEILSRFAEKDDDVGDLIAIIADKDRQIAELEKENKEKDVIIALLAQ